MQLILHYEQRAKAVRALAKSMTGSEMRQTLVMLAAQWEALAEQARKLRTGREGERHLQSDRHQSESANEGPSDLV